MGRWDRERVLRWTGDRVYRLRMALAWTRDQLAKKLRVHAYTVGRWERGESMPQPRTEDDLDRVLRDEIKRLKQTGAYEDN